MEIERADIISEYLAAAEIIRASSAEGGPSGSKQARSRLLKTFKYLEANLELAGELLLQLLEHEDIVVRIQAATHCLSLGINRQQAVETLTQAQESEEEVFSFNAWRTLKTYNRLGFLKMYPEQSPPAALAESQDKG